MLNYVIKDDASAATNDIDTLTITTLGNAVDFGDRFINLDLFKVNGMKYDDEARHGKGLHIIKKNDIPRTAYDAYKMLPQSIVNKYKECNFWI